MSVSNRNSNILALCLCLFLAIYSICHNKERRLNVVLTRYIRSSNKYLERVQRLNYINVFRRNSIIQFAQNDYIKIRSRFYFLVFNLRVVFFYKKITFFGLSLNFLNIMLEIRRRFFLIFFSLYSSFVRF